MALYKPGDKVTIVHFNPDTYYRGGVNDAMDRLSGTTQEIEDIQVDSWMGDCDSPELSNEKVYYKLRGSEWSWSCEMFEESYEI